MLSRLRRPAQVFFLLLALIFMALLVWSQWDELRTFSWHVRPVWLIPSVLALGVSWLFEIVIWRRLVRLLGGHIGFSMGFRIWFVSAIMRYIPGNVWQPLGMTVLAHRQGLRPEATVASVALYQVVNLLSAALIAAAYFALTANRGLLEDILPSSVHLRSLPLLLALPVIVFFLRPQWLIHLLNWGLRLIKRPPLAVALTPGALLVAVALEMAAWLLLGLSFAALTMSLTDWSLTGLGGKAIHLVAGYPIAYAVGYLSFLTPSGLAVREGVMVLLAGPVVGAGVITVAALAMRIWLILCEFVAAGLSLLTWPGRLPLGRGGIGAMGASAGDG
ncbi:MAG: flippase-like domain-containing protein [Caldilineales bacterium]|nr:flippase-like domain-containing protein [Caldilineales bacterium]MCW5860635.1 flippase-like domain-containing protein [Caldilineales bacterium]